MYPDIESNQPTGGKICDSSRGTLPACAPLAVPYVPFQQMAPKRYSQNDALSNGTLFPGLNLPFHLKIDAPNAVTGPLGELQALEFVLLELGLYLDTHQNDSEAVRCAGKGGQREIREYVWPSLSKRCCRA